MDMPPDPKPRPREPYTAEEIAKIIAATDAFGKNQYERLRARAMILLRRYYGIRVSDVATLRRDRIRGNQIFLHALKNGAAIWLAALRRGRFALCAVSKPYGAKDTVPMHSGAAEATLKSIKTVGRTLQAVFLKSGVSGATSRRFRHTLATEVPVKGGHVYGTREKRALN